MVVVSEGPIRITKTAIDSAWKRRLPGRRLILRDADCRGLALIVNPSSMTWSFSYRPRGRDPSTGRRPANKALTLGNPATHTPDEARAEANRLKGTVVTGADPAAERKVILQKARRERAQTVTRLVDEYAAALPSRPKLRGTGLPSRQHVADELSQVRAAVASMEIGDRPITDTTIADVRRATAAIGDRPATARARFGALSRFFDWCQEEEHLSANPCSLVTRSRRPKSVAARSHFLTMSELARLWHAASTLSDVYRDMARFLIVVPCRRGEAARLEWQHLDIKGAVWTMPATMTKNGDAHRVHLPELARAILRLRHEDAGRPRTGLVFPAPRSQRVIDTFSTIKSDMDAASSLTGWRWHDFRRSFATALGEGGIAEPVADAVLNHRQSATRSGVLGVYQRAQRWPEQVAAMAFWGQILDVAVSEQAQAGATWGWQEAMPSAL
jgi:integrase